MEFTALAICLAVIFIAVIIYSNKKNKIKLFEQMNREFGEKPENYSENFDMDFVFKCITV